MITYAAIYLIVGVAWFIIMSLVSDETVEPLVGFCAMIASLLLWPLFVILFFTINLCAAKKRLCSK